jgi:hypothetical protein
MTGCCNVDVENKSAKRMNSRSVIDRKCLNPFLQNFTIAGKESFQLSQIGQIKFLDGKSRSIPLSVATEILSGIDQQVEYTAHDWLATLSMFEESACADEKVVFLSYGEGVDQHLWAHLFPGRKINQL